MNFDPFTKTGPQIMRPVTCQPHPLSENPVSAPVAGTRFCTQCFVAVCHGRPAVTMASLSRLKEGIMTAELSRQYREHR